MAAELSIERSRIPVRAVQPRALLLLLVAAACTPEVENIQPPHRIVHGFDVAWYAEITRTSASYVELACDPKPVQRGPGCAMATTPRANQPVDCPATFVFQQIEGCCLPYYGVSTPTVTDRVYFFECPP